MFHLKKYTFSRSAAARHDAAAVAIWRVRLFLAIVLITAFGVLGAGTARAQRSGTMPRQFDGVGLDENLGAQLPLDLRFENEQGETVRLRRYFEQNKPVFLTLVYHNCPMLCPLMLKRVTRTMKSLAWTPGDEYEAVTVSFNYRETPDVARRQKKKYLKELGKGGAGKGWHFLTGSKENIQKLTSSVGFNFRWIPEKKEFAHPAALMFVSPSGTLTRYLKDWSAPPGDMRKALVEASHGTVGNVVDQALMFCFQYDPDANSYVADAFNLMRLGGVLTVIVMGAGFFILWRREHRDLEAATASKEDEWNDKLAHEA